jgi:hypothetical protein
MADNKEIFDYGVRVKADVAEAIAALNRVRNQLEGSGTAANELTGRLTRTGLAMVALWQTGKLAVGVVKKLTDGVGELQIATQRLKGMGFDQRTMDGLTRTARSIADSSRVVMSNADVLRMMGPMAARGMSGQQMGAIAAQGSSMATALTGLTGNPDDARAQAAAILQESVTLAAARGGKTPDILAYDEQLFKLREVMQDSFQPFIDAIASLPVAMRRNLTAGGISDMAALSMAGGDPQEVVGAISALREFGLHPNMKSAAPFMPMLGMFGRTSLLSTAGGTPFAFTPQLQQELAANPIAFLQKELIPRVRGQFKGKNLSPEQMDAQVRQLFHGNDELANLVTLMMTSPGSVQQSMKRIGGAHNIARAQHEAENTLPGAFAKLSASIHNLSQAASFPGLITAINGLTHLVNAIAKTAQNHPTASAVGTYGVSAGLFGGSVLLARKIMKGFRGLFGGGGEAAAGEAATSEAVVQQAVKTQIVRAATASGAGAAGEAAVASTIGGGIVGTLPILVAGSILENLRNKKGVEELKSLGTMSSQMAAMLKPGGALAGNYDAAILLGIAQQQKAEITKELTTGKLASKDADAAAVTRLLAKMEQLITSVAQGRPIQITVNANDPDAGRKVVTQITRALSIALPNATTAAGRQQNTALTGKQ